MKIFLNPALTKVLLAGILLGIAWPPLPLGLLLFISFIPLLLLADSGQARQKPYEFFRYAFLALVVRNLIILYWISMVSVAACLSTIMLISLLFAGVLSCYQWLRTYLRHKFLAYLLLVSVWVSMEWFCEVILKFPWTTLGFGLASQVNLVQWFEYTGVYGGSIWILAVNILLYESWLAWTRPAVQSRLKTALTLACILAIAVPAGFSLYTFYTYRPSMNAIQVVVVQPDVSLPAKFDKLKSNGQLDRLLALSRQAGKTNTEYFIWPETAIEPWHALNEDSLLHNASIIRIRNFLAAYPSGNIITGALTYSQNRKHGDSSWYNSALHLENADRIQIYHKTMLVPGTETSMFGLGIARGIYVYLGGLARTFSTTAPDIFYAQSGMGIAPVICFESVFGSYVAHDLVFKGAQLIAVISNDAWWGNSSGIWQHLEYMRLLAIENRRSIACSSNGGISALINQQGIVVARADPGKEAALSGELLLQEEPSYYSEHPGYAPTLSLILAGITALIALILRVTGYRRPD